MQASYRQKCSPRQACKLARRNGRLPATHLAEKLPDVALVGLDAEGKVAKWDGVATGDRPARTYFAYAGDHYSGVRPNSYNYCNGCHTGHTFIVVDPKERTGKSWNSLLPK